MPGYISEFYFEGGVVTDWVEIAIPAGTDTSLYTVVHYSSDGTIAETFSLGSVISTIDGSDIYLVDPSTPGFGDIKSNEAIALVDDTGTVLQFLTTEGNNVVATEGPANGLTSTNIGSTSGGELHQTNDGGSTYFAQAAPNPGTIPCYAPGTLIDTPDGPRAVEDLQPGDLVDTLDLGPMPIRWLRRGDQPLQSAARDDRPVMISAGAFGPDCPARDLIVSPQHRILVGGHGQHEALFGREVFAPRQGADRPVGHPRDDGQAAHHLASLRAGHPRHRQRQRLPVGIAAAWTHGAERAHRLATPGVAEHVSRCCARSRAERPRRAALPVGWRGSPDGQPVLQLWSETIGRGLKYRMGMRIFGGFANCLRRKRKLS